MTDIVSGCCTVSGSTVLLTCLVIGLHPEVVPVQGDDVSAGAADVLEGDNLLARPQSVLLLLLGQRQCLAHRLGDSLLQDE